MKKEYLMTATDVALPAPRTAADQLIGIVERYPDAPALLDGETWLSFADVHRLARCVAADLARRGAVPGDRVVISLANGPIFRLLEHAILVSGFVRVALTPRLHPREVARIVADSDAAVVCCAESDADALKDACREFGADHRVLVVDGDAGQWRQSLETGPSEEADAFHRPKPDDLAMLLYSSGTTGSPKGATVTHAAWVAQWSLALGRMHAIGPGDIVLSVAPMAHFGGSISLDCAMAGAATVPLARFSVASTLESLESTRATVLPLAPTMLKMLLDEAGPEALASSGSTLRVVPYGGSPVSAETLVSAARALPGRLFQFYGLSETLAPVTCLSADDHDWAAGAFDLAGEQGIRARRILESAGRVAPETEIRFLEPGPEPQEFAVRSPLVSRRYWNNEELTRAAFREGWFTTGDIGYLDEDGYLHLVDRKNDLIVSGGFNVYPGEVERVIASLIEVADVAVVGIPHQRWGESVHAVVVPRSSVTDVDALRTAILEACREHLAGYKKPASIKFASELPRTALGKIDRKALRASSVKTP